MGYSISLIIVLFFVAGISFAIPAPVAAFPPGFLWGSATASYQVRKCYYFLNIF